MGRHFLDTLGFSSSATQIRPPTGKTWIVRAVIEIGNGPTVVITNGTITEDWRTSDADTVRGVIITNEWYLTCVAAATSRGWLVSIEDVSFEGAR